MENSNSPGTKINSLTTDGVAESYVFRSSLSGSLDSTVSGFASFANLASEINNTSANTIYTTNRPEQSSALINDVAFTIATAAFLIV